MIEPFENLAQTLDTLLGPNGCPWDREQTLKSLRKHVLEEVCEVIDAINEGRKEALCEELGDLFLNAIFLAKLAEKEGFFHWLEPLKNNQEKLIRRHPHVFSDVNSVSTADEVLKQWEEIKKQEKRAGNAFQSPIVPRDLPALARAEKLISAEKKIRNTNEKRSDREIPEFQSEDEAGRYLIDLVAQCKKLGFHAESALRQACSHLERELQDIKKS